MLKFRWISVSFCILNFVSYYSFRLSSVSLFSLSKKNLLYSFFWHMVVFSKNCFLSKYFFIPLMFCLLIMTSHFYISIHDQNQSMISVYSWDILFCSIFGNPFPFQINFDCYFIHFVSNNCFILSYLCFNNFLKLNS